MKICLRIIAVLFILLSGSSALAAETGLMNSAWPVFHGDQKLTGQSKYDTSKIEGGVKWKFKAEGQVESSPILDREGNIYFSDHKCNLYAITPDGKEKWRFKAGDPVTSKEWGGESCSQSSPAIDKDGTVYFLPMSGNFYAVDKNGKEKWRYPVFTFKNAWPSPAIGSDGTIYVGSELYPPPETGKPQEKSAQLYAFNSDGTLKWSYEAPSSSWVNSTPSIADDGTIYTTANDCTQSCQNGIFAMNPNGSVKWKFFPTNGVLEGSVVIGSDGILYFTTKGADDPRKANFYAITPAGKEKWKFPLENGASITPGLSKDGKLYFGDWGGIFYALDLFGKELWRVQTPQGFEALSSSPAIGAEGTIYFGTIAEYFFAYTPEGKEKWKLPVEEGGVGSSPAIGADGTVYFASVSGTLYAIGEGKASQASPSSKNNTEDGAPGFLDNALPPILGLLFLACLIFLFILKKRQILTTKRLVSILALLVIIAGGLVYLSFFYSPNQAQESKNDATNKNEAKNKNNIGKTKEDYQGQCPRRVYGAADSGYYGVYDMNQFDITLKEYEWAKKNCPDAYFVGEGEVGQPGSNK